jgi:hypothetical protein
MNSLRRYAMYFWQRLPPNQLSSERHTRGLNELGCLRITFASWTSIHFVDILCISIVNCHSYRTCFRCVFKTNYNQTCLKGLRVWCLTPLSTIFQLYRGGQFYWGVNNPTSRYVLYLYFHILIKYNYFGYFNDFDKKNANTKYVSTCSVRINKMKSKNIPHDQNSSETHQKDHRKKHNRYPNYTFTWHLTFLA